MRFTKYHGTGNDFVLLDAPTGDLPSPDVVRRLSDRHFGVGADGVLVVVAGRTTAWRMVYFNADGTRAEMCGNGIRCFVKHLCDRYGVESAEVAVETDAGLRVCAVSRNPAGQVATVRVSMGRPRSEAAAIPLVADHPLTRWTERLAGEPTTVRAVSMGNPHLVVFGPPKPELLHAHGPTLARHAAFPHGTNVEFVEVRTPDALDMLVYERGVGPTLACGTGACAAVVAACLEGRLAAGRTVTVHLPGGDVRVSTTPSLDEVSLEGPAERVFAGEWLAPR